MASPTTNLFLRLHKWAARQDENFLTESLAVVLEQLLVLAPAVGTRLVSRLTGGFINLPSEDASAIEISTQVEAGTGRPDLVIRTLHRLVWVEVKVESEVRAGQLECYRGLLERSGVEQRQLILLTRYPEEFKPDAQRPDKQFRWFDVADWLRSELPACEAAGTIAVYLTQQLLDFLGDRGMTLAQVGKYMPEGVRALANLIEMLVEAGNHCGPPAKKWVGEDFAGVRLAQRKYWVGIYFSEPERLYFEAYTRINENAADSLSLFHPELKVVREKTEAGDCWCYWWVDLDSEPVHFFSRSKVRQLAWLEEFMRDSLEKAHSIEIPNQPPIPDEPEEGS
jgi:hypothetical protein